MLQSQQQYKRSGKEPKRFTPAPGQIGNLASAAFPFLVRSVASIVLFSMTVACEQGSRESCSAQVRQAAATHTKSRLHACTAVRSAHILVEAGSSILQVQVRGSGPVALHGGTAILRGCLQEAGLPSLEAQPRLHTAHGPHLCPAQQRLHVTDSLEGQQHLQIACGRWGCLLSRDSIACASPTGGRAAQHGSTAMPAHVTRT